jgi:hypothetical protein
VTEIRRITVQSQAGANSSGDSISKIPITKKDWWSGSSCRPRVETPIQKKKLEIILRAHTLSIGS